MNKNKLGFYSVIICFLVMLIGISFYFLYYFHTIKDSDFSTNGLKIVEKNDMSYTVKLLKNDYFDSNNTETYITDLVDDIKSNFNYSVSFDKRVKGEYSYFINGTLVAEKDGNKVLNREILKQNVRKYEVDGNVINLSDVLNVDFNSLYNIYNNFKKEFGIDDKAYINYEISIHYNIFNEEINRYVTNTKVLKLNVPINNTVTEVSVSPSEEEARKEFSNLTNSVKPIYLVIVAEFIGVIVLCLFIIYYLIRSIIRSESRFDKIRKNLLNKYDANIVHIKELPDLKKYNVMFVDNFKDLVDASNTLKLPINYVDVIIGHVGTFIILSKKTAYVYKLSEKDLRD